MSSTSNQFPEVPEGFLFAPTDQELLMAYLRRWILEEPLPCEAIIERDLYAENANPWELFTEDDPWNVLVTGDDHDSSRGGKKTIYVFTKLSKVGRQGNKNVIRTAGCGKWHGQTGSKDIMRGKPKSKIGLKRMFTFKSSKKDLDGKGHWIMYEYSLSDDGLIGINGSPEYVVCKIMKDESKNFKKEQAGCGVLGKRKLRDQGDYKALIGVDDQQQRRSITNGGNLVAAEADSSPMMINNGEVEAAYIPIERVQNKTGQSDDDVMRGFASYLEDTLLEDDSAVASRPSDDDVRRYASNLEDNLLTNSPPEFDSSAKPRADTEKVEFTLAELDCLTEINSLPQYEHMSDEEFAEYLNVISLGDIPVADGTSNFMSE